MMYDPKKYKIEVVPYIDLKQFAAYRDNMRDIYRQNLANVYTILKEDLIKKGIPFEDTGASTESEYEHQIPCMFNLLDMNITTRALILEEAGVFFKFEIHKVGVNDGMTRIANYKFCGTTKLGRLKGYTYYLNPKGWKNSIRTLINDKKSEKYNPDPDLSYNEDPNFELKRDLDKEVSKDDN